MNNIFNKTNAPYLITGALATLTILTSGVFAATPYFKFLAPVASLNVSFPLIIGCAVVSFAVLAFSCVMIASNRARNDLYGRYKSFFDSESEYDSERDNQSGSNVTGTAGGVRTEGKASEPVRRTMAEVLRNGLNEKSFKSR